MAKSRAMTTKGRKILLFGLADAGKTSIHHRCFLNSQLADIEKNPPPPTLLMSVDSPQVPFLDEVLNLWDLGGQEGYIKSHLSDPQIFRNLGAIIYVVDVTNSEALPKAMAHFATVEDILSENEEQPIRFVFLHKFDPSQRKTYSRNLSIFLTELQPVLPSDTMYVSTSIYDESACTAITDVLYATFPVEVLRQAFSSNFLPDIYEKFNSEQLVKMSEQIGVNAVNQKIHEVFSSLGRALGKNLKISWSKILSGDMEFKTPPGGQFLTFEAFSGRQIAIKVDCPLSRQEIDEDFPIDVCLMTRGLLEGIVETLRLGKITEKETILHSKNEACKRCLFLVLPQKGLEARVVERSNEN